MIRQWAWFGLSLGLASTALAESGVQSVYFGVPTEIPSNGVLPLFGACFDASCSSLTSALVTESYTGTAVDGHIELVMTGTNEAWAYFTPTTPFRSGTDYQVTATASSPKYTYPAWARAVEPTELTKSAVSVQPLANIVTEIKDRHCCSSSNCIDVTVRNTLELNATMSVELPIATQYLFAVSLHREGEDGVFGEFQPIRTDRTILSRAAPSDGTSGPSCYTVRARPIVGGETITLTTGCFDTSKFTNLGTQTRSAEEIAKWSATCGQGAEPPASDAGVRPSASLADASTDADGEPLGRGEEEKIPRDESGCQLASNRFQASNMTWALALLVLQFANKRRRA